MAQEARLSKKDLSEHKASSDQFKYLAELVSSFGAEAGVKIIPYHDSSLPLFSSQTLALQLKIIEDLKVFVKICNSVLNSGGRLNDSTAMSWSAIKELGLRPAADLFSFIAAENVVEIHDSAGIQIFRNFNFYEYCSYSLEELHCRPWSYLYSRNEVALAQLLSLVRRIYDREIRETVSTGIDPHIIEELHSPLKYQIFAYQDYISPLFDVTKRPAATIIIERGKILGAPPFCRGRRAPSIKLECRGRIWLGAL